MAASLKISELNAVASLDDGDLFLITDSSESTSKKLTVASLTSHLYTPLYTAVGASAGDTNMGAFTGSILSDNFSIKQLLQELANSVVSETTTRTSADTAHTTRLNILETDPVTKTYVDTKVAEVIDLAPDSLNTLNELAAALGDDPALVGGLNTRVTGLETNPTFVGTVSGDDIAIGTDKLTVSSAGGVVASVGFFTGGMLTVGGNASLTGNTTFSGGVVNFTNGIKIDGTAVTSTATELNYVDGVTSNIQTQLDSISTTISSLEIDIAPETLDSINELAAALGDNPNIIPTLQAELTEYKAHIEARNLEAGLAFGELYVDNLTGG